MRYAGLVPRQQLRQIALDLEAAVKSFGASLPTGALGEMIAALRDLAGEPRLAQGHKEWCASLRILNRGECDCAPPPAPLPEPPPFPRMEPDTAGRC